MRGKTHAAVSLLTYYNFSLLTGTPLDITSAALSVSFSLLPDLDHFQSLISKKLSNPLLEKIFESALISLILFPTLYIFKIKGLHFYLSSVAIIFLTAFIGLFIKKSVLRKLSVSFSILCLYFILKRIFPDKQWIYFAAFLCLLPWFSHRSFSHSLTAALCLFFSLKSLWPSLAPVCTIAYSSHLLLGDLWTPSGIPLFFPFSKKRFRLIQTAKSSKKILPLIEILILSALSALAFYLTLILL